MFSDPKFTAKCIPDGERIEYYNNQTLLWLKNGFKPMDMKILHPFGYQKLLAKMKDKISKIPKEVSDYWRDTSKQVYLANSVDRLDYLRTEFEIANRFVIRFDIRLFYEAVYTHVLSCLDAGSYEEGKTFWNKNKQLGRNDSISNAWLSLIEDSILNMQYRETTGLPIGSDLMQEFAECCLIRLDSLFMKDKPVDNVIVIRRHDNYDVICDTAEDCERMVFFNS